MRLFLLALLPLCNALEHRTATKTVISTAECQFSVHRDGPGGEPVTGVELDVQLYYSIRCKPKAGYCLKVSNCTVSPEESSSSPYPIIDEEGCSLEPSLYHHVSYESDFSAGIVNPLPIRFRSSSSAVLLFCVTSLQPSSVDGVCPRPSCPPDLVA